jgi:hypothetical protein
MKDKAITKHDLRAFKAELITELKEVIFNGSPKAPEQKWQKSGPIRRFLNVSHGTLQTLRIKGLLHPKKINGRYYYNLKEVNDLFQSKKSGGLLYE